VKPNPGDRAGRLLSIPGHVTALHYNARGQVIRAEYANGVSTTNTYDDYRGWLEGVLTTGPAGTLQDITFTRDRKGRITAVRSAYRNHQNRAVDDWNYTYDTLDRLVTRVFAARDKRPSIDIYSSRTNTTVRVDARDGRFVTAFPGRSQRF
jgi:YD repeat-containing protein